MSTSDRIRRAAPIATATSGVIGLPAVAQAMTLRYHCADGTMLSAQFSPGRVDLRMGKSVLSLLQTLSADGGRYGGTGLTFWIKGKGAELMRGARQTRCSTP